MVRNWPAFCVVNNKVWRGVTLQECTTNEDWPDGAYDDANTKVNDILTLTLHYKKGNFGLVKFKHRSTVIFGSNRPICVI